ncbi:sugar ABC transporter ATP-binding protein [Christensenella hongkongensis]|uniref:Ribose ABC transport system, ATP-binding protein RbsA n=2 Tax=Christensenella hongkongensis TaxID=270498 RepID=A0A0M2NHE3_9FIRM|nr:sugar ABC transporter ATP-binding protein [Christensenella hongkongensis]KKI49847.1 Ribose ABC transport system, ATP-binding protein RbsA [Christensenella hongkongensis]TCW25982.1 monosaccharide ABC transporter ATP-binding protein (CUT2 family) [Christensenella hongkongensis]
MAEVVVSMKEIQKSFPGVHALDDAQIELKKGEVHGLIGENGAGKSTLMKVLTGIYERDSGTVVVKGREVHYKTPGDALEDGISMIHQELNLMPHLTVADNIFIGREPKKGLVLDKREVNRQTKALLESLNLDIDPNTTVSRLSVAKQQMVEIAKAISLNSDILIMDEPTAALTTSEIDELFKFVNDLKAKGVGIVYISHRMEELKIITDDITVMRDGQYVDTVRTADTDMDQIISMMVGRTIYEEPKTKSSVPEGAPTVLKVEHLSSPDVHDVSFELKKGEILGLAGLMGAGRTETARLIFGADPMTDGKIFINGKQVNIMAPFDAVENGIGYLSEDRKAFGLAIGLSVADNTVMADMDNFVNGGIVNEGKIAKVTNEYVDKINIKTPSIKQLVRNLSGGNQQKVVIAKWLVKNCDILIFDEPTRGIDVGAKSEIYKLMNQLAGEGKSIIMISSEMPELLRMSDRIIVMCEGKMTGEIDIAEATQEGIMKFATLRS